MRRTSRCAASVSMNPGATVFTRTPFGPTSFASPLLYVVNAAFAAAYARVASNKGRRRWMDEMWTMTPAPRLSIAGRNARSRRTAASRFVSSSRCHSSSVSAAKPPLGADEPPTLLTMMSRPSNASITERTTFLTLSDVLRSAWTNSAGACPSGRLERAVVATFAPPAARRRAMASPIPCVPPVTRTRLPVNSVGSSEKRDMSAPPPRLPVVQARPSLFRQRHLGPRSGLAGGDDSAGGQLGAVLREGIVSALAAALRVRGRTHRGESEEDAAERVAAGAGQAAARTVTLNLPPDSVATPAGTKPEAVRGRRARTKGQAKAVHKPPGRSGARKKVPGRRRETG